MQKQNERLLWFQTRKNSFRFYIHSQCISNKIDRISNEISNKGDCIMILYSKYKICKIIYTSYSFFGLLVSIFILIEEMIAYIFFFKNTQRNPNET